MLELTTRSTTVFTLLARERNRPSLFDYPTGVRAHSVFSPSTLMTPKRTTYNIINTSKILSVRPQVHVDPLHRRCCRRALQPLGAA